MTGTAPFRRRPAVPQAVIPWTPADLLALTAECRSMVLDSAVGRVVVRRHDDAWRPTYSVGFVTDLEPGQACQVLIQLGGHLPDE